MRKSSERFQSSQMQRMKELALEKTRLDGRYEIREVLGRGSYAEIYLARDLSAAPESPHALVVIKALNVFLQEEPDVELERTLIENFQNEAVALDLVRHPNVINRLGHGTARDLRGTIFHYLVLEYLPGGDLMQLCKRAPLTLEKTLVYLEQVCAGLAHAHASNIIHRDIKPQNLLLTRDQKTVKIADFGVARFSNLDAPITRVGTNIYAAPEHSPLNAALESAASENARLTPAADVYSLAKTVYALLTGESPRRFSNAPLTDWSVTLSEKTWAADVLPVLEHATQTNVNARTATVDDFWNEMYLAASSAEAATQILKPDLLTTIVGDQDFSVAAPASPSFSSLPNVQIPVRNIPELPERPRLVVQLGKTPTVASLPVTSAASTSPSPFKTIPNNGAMITNGNIQLAKEPEQKTPLRQTVEQVAAPRRPSRLTAFFKRLMLRFAVVLLLLGTFAGVLAGTFNYLQTRGYFPTILTTWTIKKGIVIASGANLRSSATEKNDNIIGFVTKDSELKILGEEGSWYKVEIVRQGQPDNDNITDKTNGYVGKKLVEVQ